MRASGSERVDAVAAAAASVGGGGGGGTPPPLSTREEWEAALRAVEAAGLGDYFTAEFQFRGDKGGVKRVS